MTFVLLFLYLYIISLFLSHQQTGVHCDLRDRQFFSFFSVHMKEQRRHIEKTAELFRPQRHRFFQRNLLDETEMFFEMTDDLLIGVFFVYNLLADSLPELPQMIFAGNHFEDPALVGEDSLKFSVICGSENIQYTVDTVVFQWNPGKIGNQPADVVSSP